MIVSHNFIWIWTLFTYITWSSFAVVYPCFITAVSLIWWLIWWSGSLGWYLVHDSMYARVSRKATIPSCIYFIHDTCIYRYGSVPVRHGIISSICTCSWPMHHACTYRFRVQIVRSHDQMVELLYYTASFTVTSTTSWVSFYKWRIETSKLGLKCPLYIWSWTAMVVEMFAAALLFAIACWWATQWARSVS